jgi:hypothetical protein
MKPIKLAHGNVYGSTVERTLAGAIHRTIEVWECGAQPRGVSAKMAKVLSRAGTLMWLPDPKRAPKRRAKR